MLDGSRTATDTMKRAVNDSCDDCARCASRQVLAVGWDTQSRELHGKGDDSCKSRLVVAAGDSGFPSAHAEWTCICGGFGSLADDSPALRTSGRSQCGVRKVRATGSASLPRHQRRAGAVLRQTRRGPAGKPASRNGRSGHCMKPAAGHCLDTLSC